MLTALTVVKPPAGAQNSVVPFWARWQLIKTYLRLDRRDVFNAYHVHSFVSPDWRRVHTSAVDGFRSNNWISREGAQATTLVHLWVELGEPTPHLLADDIGTFPEFPEERKRIRILADRSRKQINDCPEQLRKRDVFYVMLDNITGNLTVWYKTANDINERVNCLWKLDALSAGTDLGKKE